MKTLLIPALVSLLQSAPVPSAQQSVCRPDNERHRAMVVRILARPDFQDVRETYGLTAVDPASLRVLTDGQDAATCQTLSSLVRDQSFGPFTYYTAGGFYFLAVRPPERPGYFQLGFGRLLVLNPDFTVRALLAT